MTDHWSQWSPEAWQQRIKERDIEAWQLIVKLASDACRKQLSQEGEWEEISWSDIEDIAHDALCNVVDRVLRGASIQYIRTYVWKVALNELAARKRKIRQRRKNEEPLPMTSEGESMVAQPEAATQLDAIDVSDKERAALYRALADCYARLSELDRQIVDQMINRGVRRAQIIAQLGLAMTEATLNVRIHRILKKKLAGCLGDQGFSSQHIGDILN